MMAEWRKVSNFDWRSETLEVFVGGTDVDCSKHLLAVSASEVYLKQFSGYFMFVVEFISGFGSVGLFQELSSMCGFRFIYGILS